MADLVLDINNPDQIPDLELADRDLAAASGVVTAVLVALFTDARAGADDGLAPGVDPRGHWGDAFTPGPLGGLLWLVEREKITPDLIPRIREYATSALQRGVIDPGYARRVDIDVTRTARDTIAMRVAVDVPGDMHAETGRQLEIAGLDVDIVIRADRAMRRTLAQFESI